MKEGPYWYYCKRHNHWWTDSPDIDHGTPTGFNKGEKDCEKGRKIDMLPTELRMHYEDSMRHNQELMKMLSHL